MHRLRSRASLRNFRLAVLLMFLFVAALAGFIGLGAAVVLAGRSQLLNVFLGAAALVPLLWLAYLSIGLRARCPLCMNPPLVPRHCQKHRNARTSLGSHRLRVALEMIFSGRFTCPHCGETTAMEVRERRHRRR